MSSFLNRLKKKEIIPATPEDDKNAKLDAQKQAAPVEPNTIDQLKVDIFQTPSAIVLYAQLAGAGVHDFGVLVEGDGDIVTIKGQRTRPNGEHFQGPGAEGKESILEECSWGRFYRQIILPAEVESDKAEAKMKEGVLMLLLPLKNSSDKGTRINVTALQ